MDPLSALLAKLTLAELAVPEEVIVGAIALPPGMAVNGNGQRPPAPPFDKSTRLSVVPLAAIARPTGGGTSPAVQLPQNGIIGGMLLDIRGAVGGTVGTVNAAGFAAIIRRVTIRLNSGTVLFSLTGPNYHYLYRDFIDTGYIDVLGQTNARDAITATNGIVSMIFPFQVNLRDQIGLFMLQNRQTQMYLEIEWETDANITSTGTVTGWTATPQMLLYSTPVNAGSLPNLDFVHQVVDEERVVSGAGQVVYDVPRANVYQRILHGAGVGATGADSWTRAQLRVNQTSYIWDTTPNQQNNLFWYFHGRARELGQICFEFAATSGLGEYGSPRDLLNSNRYTDLQTVVEASGAITLRTVRDQIVPIDQA